MTKTPTVTVVIGIRNRYDYRIVNALRSLRIQTYAKELIEIRLVDYGSDILQRPVFDRLCAEFKVRGIWVETQNVWNKAHCLNIAIRQATTDYILVSDADIVFQDNYIQTCITAAQRGSARALYAPMMDLPAGKPGRELTLPTEYMAQRVLAHKRKPVRALWSDFVYGSSIIFAETQSFTRIRGYDESYKLWGSEDHDLIRRFQLSGLTVMSIGDKTSHLHQWHPKHENSAGVPGYTWQILRNRLYFYRHRNTIMRNQSGWGDPESIFL